MLRRKVPGPALFLFLSLALPILLALFPAAVYAHGFGERYDLPLPLGYFAIGGGLAVILSFAVIGFFVGDTTAAGGYPRLNLFRGRPLRILLTGPVYGLLRMAALFLFLLVIATGLFGTQRPVNNLTPTFVWIIWWVGMGFAVALLGNLWAVVNPWKTIYDLAETIYRRFKPQGELDGGRNYPESWGVWPAAILFFAFAWIENALPEAAAPALLAGLIIAYSILTLGGMYLFGPQQWLRQGEVFSVIYGILTRFAVTEARAVDPDLCRECSAPQCRVNGGGFILQQVQDERGAGSAIRDERGDRLAARGVPQQVRDEWGDGPAVRDVLQQVRDERGDRSAVQGVPQQVRDERNDGDGGGCVDCYECFELAEVRELNLRPPAIGLNRPGHGRGIIVPGMTALTLLLLATVTFDGFSDTPEWAAVLGFFLERTPALTSPYFNGLVIANTLGLLAFPLLFAALYRGVAGLMRRAAGNSGPEAGPLMAAFVFSLVPIALAYHFAHYLGFLLIQGQLIIPLASDPFGYGWDLFGGAGYGVNIAITNARFIWFFALTVIVAGHIIAVYLAHLRAGEIYGTRRAALKSQIPMLALMVFYTVASLWIISRPITE